MVTRLFTGRHLRTLGRSRKAFGPYRAALLPAAGLVALLTAACASTAGPSGVPPASDAGGSAPPPAQVAGRSAAAPTGGPRPARLVLTLSDSGKTVTVQLGDQVRVVLGAGWVPPSIAPGGRPIESAPLSSLRLDSRHGFPEAGAARADFTAVRVGSTIISSHTGSMCVNAEPFCSRPERSVAFTVQVLPAPGHGAGPLPQPAPS